MAALTLIQMRRGTAAQWTTANPVLTAGEPGYETDTGKFKLGNGTETWNALQYIGADRALAGHNHTTADISDATATGRSLMKVADATAGRTLLAAAASSHTHAAVNITDSTATGRSLMTAADAAAARSTIGAGTSNLAIGTTASTAMAGNKTFAYTEITGIVPTSALPPLAINEITPVASQAAMLALTAQRGDMAIRTDTNDTYVLATDSPSTLADWKKIMAAGDVQSVAGKTGVITLAKTDVGLSNVDNTSDLNKPISTSTQTALNAKANASHTHDTTDITTIDGGTP